MARFNNLGINEIEPNAAATLASLLARPVPVGDHILSITTTQPLNIGSGSAASTAHLAVVTPDFGNTFTNTATVKLTVLLDGVIVPLVETVNVVIDAATGEFSLPLPANTVAFRVMLALKDIHGGVSEVDAFFPDTCMYDIMDDDPVLRRVFRLCSYITIDTSGLDHLAPAPGDTRVQHQLGPCRSARAMAIVHIAIMEAYVAIRGGFTPFSGLTTGTTVSPTASLAAAIIRATHDTLLYLYPSHQPRLDPLFAGLIAQLTNVPAADVAAGQVVGAAAAAEIIARRLHDGSDHAEPVVGVDYIPSGAPQDWTQDPISLNPLALGGRWAALVSPFVLTSASQYRAPPPPDPTSHEYAMQLMEVESVGGDGIITPTIRTEYMRLLGLAYAYDGTSVLCAPPRLFIQMTWAVLDTHGMPTKDLIRHMAVLCTAMADTALAAWDTKYYYNTGRPVTVIRRASELGNSRLVSDPVWTPYGAPITNKVTAVRLSPPFPGYVSGHATFGKTVFKLLETYYGTTKKPFVYVSDELNGITKDQTGDTRPLAPLFIGDFNDAVEQCGQSRMYLGIHVAADKNEGIKMGDLVADWVNTHIYTPIP